MLTDDQTAASTPSSPAPAPRTVLGTMWRAVVVVLVCLGTVTAGAWVGAKAMQLDGRLLEAPAAVPMLAVIALAIVLLRAQIWFAVVPGLAADAAACAGAVMVQDRLFSSGRLHLDTLGARLSAGGFAVAILVGVIGIVVAAVVGHRHPRENDAPSAA